MPQYNIPGDAEIQIEDLKKCNKTTQKINKIAQNFRQEYIILHGIYILNN